MGRRDKNAAKAEQAAKDALARAEEALAEARKAATAAGEQARATLSEAADTAGDRLETARETVRERTEAARAAAREQAETAKASVAEARDKVSDPSGQPEPEEAEKSGGFFKKLLALAAIAGAVAFANNLKRRRDQELDESLWDDPAEL